MTRINTSFYLLIFSALIIATLAVTLLYKIYPLLFANSLYICQKFITDIMLKLPRQLPDVFVTTIGIAVTVGFASLMLQLLKTRIFLKGLLLRKKRRSSKLRRTLEKLNISYKIILIEDKNLLSFSGGFFSPFILISAGLIKALSKKELEAVLLHEQSHLINRDPVKILFGKTLSSMFFFLPVFRELYKNTEAVNELLADQWIITRQGTSDFLRSALKKIISAPQFQLTAVSNIASPDYFEIRIRRLADPTIKQKFRFSKFSLVTSLLFILISFIIMQMPVSAFHMNSRMDQMEDNNYFLCSRDFSCQEKCHTLKSSEYIPDNFSPQKECN